jgi:hypothetical protein
VSEEGKAIAIVNGVNPVFSTSARCSARTSTLTSLWVMPVEELDELAGPSNTVV